MTLKVVQKLWKVDITATTSMSSIAHLETAGELTCRRNHPPPKVPFPSYKSPGTPPCGHGFTSVGRLSCPLVDWRTIILLEKKADCFLLFPQHLLLTASSKKRQDTTKMLQCSGHFLCPKEIHLEMPKMKDLRLGWSEVAHSLGNAVM